MMFKNLLFALLMLLSAGVSTVQAQPGNPCDPNVVADLTQDLIDEGFHCLVGAGPFACVDDVLNYAFENCPPPVDTTFGNPCDSALVNQLVAELIGGGFECLEGAGPFTCVDQVFEYAFENCPPPIDTTCNPCDSAAVSQLIQCLIAEGFECLEGAGPFPCVDNVFDYVFENCPPPIDTTFDDPCDSLVVDQFVQDLIAGGFTCLDGAGPFACVDAVLEYAFENCPFPVDTTGWDPCDSVLVGQVIADLILQGFACLDGAGPFECVDEVFDYAFENCPVPVDTFGGDLCTPAAVADATADLIAQGYTCLVGAGPFDCVHDVLCYALENCPQPMDTTVVPIPACLLNIPTTVTTFQQFIQYAAANCDSTVLDGIPACWLTAPALPTDEAFFEWIFENCPGTGNLVIGSENPLMQAFFTGATTAVRNDAHILTGLSATPNPANADVEIRLANGQINRVELFDLAGQKVFAQESVGQSRVRIDLGHLPAGVYMARVVDAAQRIGTQRIVKQ